MVSTPRRTELAALDALLGAAERRLFSAPDTVCLARARLVTERWPTHAACSPALRRARVLDHILRHLPLDLDSNPLMAGNTSARPRAWTVMPEFGFAVDEQACVEHDWLHPTWLADQLPADLRSAWQGRQLGGSSGPGHLAIDATAVVDRGLDALCMDLEQYAGRGTIAQQEYRQAMLIALRTVVAWAERYAEAAEHAAGRARDPVVAACHRRVAQACAWVPRHRARTLFEGLQALALVHLALVLEGQGTSLSPGALDRALARFADDAANQPHLATLWCGAFLLKIAGNAYHGRVSKTQAITLGGADTDGRDRSSAITMAFLRAFQRVAVADPHCFLRWHRALDDRVWRQALVMLSAGRSLPLLVNDHVAAAGLIHAGVAPADAWDYCIIGCNEIGVPGRACQCAAAQGLHFNDLELLDAALRRRPGPCAVHDALAAYAEVLGERVREGVDARRAWIERKAELAPFPLTSALMHGCVAAGADYQRAMPYADLWGSYTRGTANAADVLAALAHGPTGEPAPRWGNDDDRADRWAVALGEARTAALREGARRAGRPAILCTHVVRSLHHVDGRRIGATLDGRRAGEPVGDSIGAVTGRGREGPTALLNSVLKLDAVRDYAGLYNLNLTLPGGAQSSPPVLGALCTAFFEAGGQELQVAVLDADQLRAAQREPARFAGLVVRIAGLNARFIELSRREQDELIRRAEHGAQHGGGPGPGDAAAP